MATKKPIIVIPGITGTKLFNSNDPNRRTIWSGLKMFFANIHKLKLQKDGKHDRSPDVIIERADIENLAYSEIINYLKAQDYRVFIFGYDWRKSNIETGKALGAFIDKLRDKLNTGSFNFLTHSMGALVLSGYLKSLTEEERNKIVNKGILTVPPFLGSVEASFNLIIGKSRFLNTSDDFRKVARTFPSIYELLPVYEGAFGFENPETEANFNPYDFATYWQRVKDVDREDTRKKHRLIAHRLKELGKSRDQNNFLFDFSHCKKSFRDKFVVICGGKSETKESIFIQDKKRHIKNYFDFGYYEDSEDGDGTVPLPSAVAFKDALLTLKVNQSRLEMWADALFPIRDWHAFFLNNGRVQNIIKRFLKEDGDLGGSWFESLSGGIEVVE